jgi:uncharacterized membrane protein YidH (DUF202 family)
MKRAFYTLSQLGLLAMPAVSAAAGIATGGDGGKFGTLLKNILTFANDVLIPFIIGIGFLVFVWGMFKYFVAGGHDAAKQKEGKDLMIYATLGFVLMVVFWGVVNLLAASTGLQGDTLQNRPQIQTN